jgi:uncharacterized repeat protein (TIGR02543 family)
VQLVAEARPGYVFESWTENDNVISTNRLIVFTVTGDRTLVANFTPNGAQFRASVTIDPANGGSVSGAGVYPANSTVTLTATAQPDFQFQSWSGVTCAEGPTSSTCSFAITTRHVCDREVHAALDRGEPGRRAATRCPFLLHPGR